MDTSSLRRNPHIYDAVGAYKAFQSLDFDRLRAANVKSRARLYLALTGNQESGRVSVCYEGVLTINPEAPPESFDLDDIILPRPVYSLSLSQQRRGQIYEGGEVPLNATLERPARVEFSICANSPQDYAGMQAFVNHVVPYFFQQGYRGYNTDHHSQAWFEVGQEKVDEHVLFMVGLDSLEISEPITLAGAQILTPADITRLMQLNQHAKTKVR